MCKILIPTDGSESAKHAFDYALNLYQGRQAEFILFRSFDIPIYTVDMPMPIDSWGHEELKQMLEKEAEKLRNSYKDSGFSFSTRVDIGSLASNVSSLVDELGIDSIVMGTKGATGMAAVVIGSNTADVIQAASCSVIAVPEDAEITVPAKILFASDNKGLSSAEVIEPMIDFAKQFKSHIHLMNVLDEGKASTVDEAIAGLTLDQLLEGIDHTFHFEDGKDKAQVIESYLNTHEINMLAVIPRKNNFFDAIFHRSVTKKLALHTKVPLLAMHDLG